MAGGNNKQFIQNPIGYIRCHVLTVVRGHPQPPRGPADLDLVTIDPKKPSYIQLQDYHRASRTPGARVLNAFFLPKVIDDTSIIKVNMARSYIFTSELNQDLFAAYGPDPFNITIEQVNTRSPAARVPIVPRAQAIIAAQHQYYKILSPFVIPRADPTHIKNYSGQTTLVGILGGSGWTFYYKPSSNSLLPV